MVIGLSGKARSGKTTLADYLVEKHGFVKINFKDGLVDEMVLRLPDVLDKLLFGEFIIDDEGISRQCESVKDLFKYKPPIMRALMQNYGTDVRRKDKDDYWVERWLNKVASALEMGRNIVVDDVRFLNEADAVKLQGGMVIKIKRSDITDTGEHQSEVEMDSIEFDHIIPCDKGDHDCLYNKMEEILKDYDREEE